MSRNQESAIQAVLAWMAEQIAAAAPHGWKRAKLHGFATDSNGAGHRGFFFEPDELNTYGSNEVDVFDRMRELHSLMESEDDLTIELELEAGGRYRAVLSERLARTDDRAFRYLLTSEARPPTEADELLGRADTSEAGNPADAVALLSRYLDLLQEIIGPYADLDLPDALPELDRAKAETEIGIPLPRDLGALYATVDGDGGRGLLRGHTWFGLEAVAMLCHTEERWWASRGWRHYKLDSFVREFGSVHAIRRASDHPAWIPFATDTGGNFLAVDMAPGPRGRPGQVILIGRDHDDGPTYVADSVTSLLRDQVEPLAAGDYQETEDGLLARAGNLGKPRAEYEETSTLEVTGANATPVRGLTPEIRELTVSNAPWVDLRSIRNAPALWRVSMNNCPGANLAPLRDVPIEVLELSLAKIDLTGLEGHPNLQRLVLRTEGEDDLRPSKKPYVPKKFTPVDLRPLVSCPRLYALDLCDAVVADYGVLRELTGLRYLRMRRPQWEELLRQKAAPTSLVVADLAREPLAERKWFWSFDKAYKKPRPTLTDAVEWAGKLGGDGTADASAVRTFDGRFRAPRRR